jgi:hypothetical protein
MLRDFDVRASKLFIRVRYHHMRKVDILISVYKSCNTFLLSVFSTSFVDLKAVQTRAIPDPVSRCVHRCLPRLLAKVADAYLTATSSRFLTFLLLRYIYEPLKIALKGWQSETPYVAAPRLPQALWHPHGSSCAHCIDKSRGASVLVYSFWNRSGGIDCSTIYWHLENSRLCNAARETAERITLESRRSSNATHVGSPPCLSAYAPRSALEHPTARHQRSLFDVDLRTPQPLTYSIRCSGLQTIDHSA